MLSYPDREKFLQIRSRWESVQSEGDRPCKMVGRREKSMGHQPVTNDENTGPSSFRRKLSHGLSFISSPLAQRKTIHETGLSLNTAGPVVRAPILSREPDGEPSSSSDSKTGRDPPVLRKTPPSSNGTGKENILDADATPKPLPRSQTMSFIPRPNRNSSMTSTAESDTGSVVKSTIVSLEKIAATSSSKIPTPSPPASERRISSPRQYTTALTAQQAKHVAAGKAFHGAGVRVPSKSSLRSRTTPNLTQLPRSPRSTSFMAHRHSVVPKSSAATGSGKGILKENTSPPTQHHNKRLSLIKENSPQRQNLASPKTYATQRSLGHNSFVTPSKQMSPATPSTTTRQRSSQQVTQTPLAQQRALPKQNRASPKDASNHTPNVNGSAISQNRLLGPMSPPTPPKAKQVNARPSLPRSSTEKDFRKRTFTTPRRSGMSRFQGGAGHEVRRPLLPRSFTVQDLGRLETPPPVPSIPDRFKLPPLPIVPEEGKDSPGVSDRPPPNTIVMVDYPTYGKATTTGKLPSSASAPILHGRDNTLPMHRYYSGQTTGVGSNGNDDVKPLKSILKSPSGLLMLQPKSELSLPMTNDVIAESTSAAEFTANLLLKIRVKEYMPMLYWAGRFQSRFDQWRTEAMRAQLDSRYYITGPLGRCNLDQEGKAACHIFMQLRDLCVSNAAADSLWEYELSYRREHKLLGREYELYPINKYQRDGSNMGSIGRAVRKLTPRKSSFVNLIKGKGWNTDDVSSGSNSNGTYAFSSGGSHASSGHGS
ncbi:hypothetical protein P280DRAFT_546311 [Massarina eburnea CBS 473.64]|uniref:Uncharacterized protein n=1 Tax=Massarina eburnea CBS 473.64 TaxID=1395130 RepID=A0A6A6SCL0_9PLEO|nr:hypothetical protein P280DRAFT_546311 [Massarina eburnea CBS 473.64]